MTYITLSDPSERRLTFYLAMEEYVARHLDVDDAFFTWQVGPTVIFGRNQLIHNEVNLDYCRENGIATYRQKSGGGCVYADRGNLMLSYITKDENVRLTFNRYINLLVLVLYKMGIEAKATGRNDVLIDGRKVSGNAFYHLPGKSIVHGTLLYDTHMGHMTASITPSHAKLESKGVGSVRQHIELLKDHTTMTLDEVNAHIRETLCDSELTLDETAIRRIEQIEEGYLSQEFIYGHNPRATIHRKGRIEGVGDFDVRLQTRGGLIREADILGDFFLVGDIEEGILAHLRGLPPTPDTLKRALPADLGDTILHLRADDLINIIFNPHTTLNQDGKQTNLSL